MSKTLNYQPRMTSNVRILTCLTFAFCMWLSGCVVFEKKSVEYSNSGNAMTKTVLYYATNREYLGGSDPENFFGNQAGSPSSRIRYGIYPVSTDSNGLNFKPGNLRIITRDDWINDIRGKAIENGKPTRTILIFVHGYNTSFNSAAESLARLNTGFGDDIVPVFYTWPSRSKFTGYLADENEVEKSVKYFADFLHDLKTSIPEANVAIVAHSMGNRVVVEAVEMLSRREISTTSTSKKRLFKTIALVAADIDRETYESRFSDPVSAAAERVLVYASAKDKALAASQKVHDAVGRLGQNYPAPYYDKKSETIDASDAGTDFLAHGYVVSNRAVINDLAYAICNDLPAWRRKSLRPYPNALAARYWWLLIN